MSTSGNDWHLKIFSKSVIKQAKWRQIHRLIGDMHGRVGLDLGSDNGVISYLLRQLGGTWHSSDLNTHTVESIRSLVGDRVFPTDGSSLALADNSVDVVVIVDMLEHLQDDRALVKEVARVLRPSGKLIANVPHVKCCALLRPLRLALGLTDQWHGHVRPGYSRASLDTLLADDFTITKRITYNRFFSELLDILLNYAYGRKKKASDTNATKTSDEDSTKVSALESSPVGCVPDAPHTASPPHTVSPDWCVRDASYNNATNVSESDSTKTPATHVSKASAAESSNACDVDSAKTSIGHSAMMPTTESSKGHVVTGEALAKQAKAFRLYSVVYPFMRAFAALDFLALPFTGYSLIVSADKTS